MDWLVGWLLVSGQCSHTHTRRDIKVMTVMGIDERELCVVVVIRVWSENFFAFWLVMVSSKNRWNTRKQLSVNRCVQVTCDILFNSRRNDQFFFICLNGRVTR